MCASLLGIFCHSCANVQTRFNVSSLQIVLPVIILVFAPSSLSVTLFICLYPSLSVSSYEKFCLMNISFSPSYPPLLGILCGISARRIRYFEHLHTACPWPFTVPWHIRRWLQKVSVCFGVFFLLLFWIIISGWHGLLLFLLCSLSGFSQCARLCLKAWWRSWALLPVRPPTPSSAISVERRRWVDAPHWPSATSLSSPQYTVLWDNDGH